MMRGTDVRDWQQFLVTAGHSTDAPDSIFGGNTATASKAFQASVGIGADGVVGPFTLARALQKGFVSSVEPLRAGMDASRDCTQFAAQIVAAGMKFVVRYYSLSASKAITLPEAKALSAAGLQLVVVYQDRNDKLQRFSAAIGAQQATNALASAAALGQPAGSAIYFACDFDPSPTEARGPVMEYFHAVHDVIGPSPYSVGVYGSGLTCRLIRDAGFARFTWLSQSTGFRDYRAFLPQANMVQAVPARDLIKNKLNIDDDIAQTADIGSFQV